MLDATRHSHLSVAGSSRAYEMRHIVTFEETNLVGNVYYVHMLRWHGQCRELFLRDKAPEVLESLRTGLALVTLRCECDYVAELEAFDEVIVRMRLASIVQNRIDLLFETWRASPPPLTGAVQAGTRSKPALEIVGWGRQTVGCLARGARGLEPVAIPEALLAALEPYAAAD